MNNLKNLFHGKIIRLIKVVFFFILSGCIYSPSITITMAPKRNKLTSQASPLVLSPLTINTIYGQNWKFTTGSSASIVPELVHTGAANFDSVLNLAIYQGGIDTFTLSDDLGSSISANMDIWDTSMDLCNATGISSQGRLRLGVGVKTLGDWCWGEIIPFWASSYEIKFENVTLDPDAWVGIYDKDWNYITSYDSTNLPPTNFTSFTQNGIIVEFDSGSTDTTSTFDVIWKTMSLPPSNIISSVSNLNISKGSTQDFVVVGGLAPYNYSVSNGASYISQLESHKFRFSAPTNDNNFSLTISDSSTPPSEIIYSSINLTEPVVTMALTAPSLSTQTMNYYDSAGSLSTPVYLIPEGSGATTIRFTFAQPLISNRSFNFSFNHGAFSGRANAVKGTHFTTNEPIQALVGDTYVDLIITPISNNYADVDRVLTIGPADSTSALTGTAYFAIADAGNTTSTLNMDLSINSNGAINFGNETQVKAVSFNSLGKIFAIANDFTTSSFSTSYLKKFNESTGALDTSFGTSGSVSRSGSYIHWFGIKIMSDDKIVTGGYQENGGRDAPKLWKWTTTGATDATFGSSGLATFTGFAGIEIESQRFSYNSTTSQFIMPGAQYDNYVVAVRLNSNGSTDATFNGATGKLIFNTIPKCNSTKSIYNSVGKIYQIGHCRPGGASSDTDAMLWRLNADGTLDTTYQTGGYKLISALLTTGKDEIVKDVIVDTSDKVYLLIETRDSSNKAHGIIQKLNDDGSIDSSFNSGINKDIQLDSKDTVVNSFALDAINNRIFITGSVNFYTVPTTSYTLQKPALWAITLSGADTNLFGPAGVYLISTENQRKTPASGRWNLGLSVDIDSTGRIFIGGMESSINSGTTRGMIWVLH